MDLLRQRSCIVREGSSTIGDDRHYSTPRDGGLFLAHAIRAYMYCTRFRGRFPCQSITSSSRDPRSPLFNPIVQFNPFPTRGLTAPSRPRTTRPTWKKYNRQPAILASRGTHTYKHTHAPQLQCIMHYLPRGIDARDRDYRQADKT